MITYERLTEVLDYDPLIGVFKWKIAVKLLRESLHGDFVNHGVD